MDLLSLLVGVIIGFVLGAGALLFYIRRKMTHQLGAMQEEMDEMFDMTDDIMEELPEEDDEEK
jgi:uncharacterized membrane-anchored protein YhcB (DUF1043 family)